METYNSVIETKLESDVSKDTTDMSEEVLKDVHPTQSEDDKEKTQQGKKELIQSKKQTEHNQHEPKVTPLDSNVQAGCKTLQPSKITPLLFTELFFKQEPFLLKKRQGKKIEKKVFYCNKKKKILIAEDGFDPSTSGL